MLKQYYNEIERLKRMKKEVELTMEKAINVREIAEKGLAHWSEVHRLENRFNSLIRGIVKQENYLNNFRNSII